MKIVACGRGTEDYGEGAARPLTGRPSLQITLARPVAGEMARKLPLTVAPYSARDPVTSPHTLL